MRNERGLGVYQATMQAFLSPRKGARALVLYLNILVVSDANRLSGS